jgi:hypothetical protein
LIKPHNKTAHQGARHYDVIKVNILQVSVAWTEMQLRFLFSLNLWGQPMEKITVARACGGSFAWEAGWPSYPVLWPDFLKKMENS